MPNTTETSLPLAEQLSIVEKIVGSAAIGLVLGLSCASYGVWWLAWCAMAPFLVLLRACRSWVEAVAVGMSFGSAYSLLTLFWLYGLHIPGVSPQLTPVIAITTALVDILARAIPYAFFSLLLYALPMRAGIFPEYRRPFFPYLLCIPIAWIFFEYVSGMIVGTHINDLCYSQSGQLFMIQIARLGGGKLLTFLIVLANTALAQLIFALANLVEPLGKRTDRLHPTTGSIIDLMTVVLVAALCALIGRGNPGSCLNTNVPAVTASLSQSSTEQIIGINGSAVVSCANGVSNVLLKPGQAMYSAAHKSYLSVVLLLPLQVLHCVAPKTANELMSYVAALPKDSLQIISSPWGQIGITNVALPKTLLEKEATRQGAGLLLYMVDPVCFHSTILDKQILAAAIMSAVENGRYVILSTTKGICAIINPCGEIIAKSIPQNANALSEQIRFLYRNTYYSNVEFN